MKRPDSSKWMVLGICALILLSITLTIMVLKSHEVSTETQIKIPKIETLSNVYIVSCENDKITFLYEGNTYTKEGKLETSFTGIADLVLKKGKVVRVFQKTDYINGRLLSYESNRIEIEGYGYVDSEEYWSIYRDCDGVQSSITANDLVIGSSDLNYYVANNKICAIVQLENTAPAQIRVLIKNGTEDTFSNLWVKSDSILQAGDWSIPADTSLEIENYFADCTEETSVTLQSADGLIYVGDTEQTIGTIGYEGSIEIRRMEDGTFALVSVVPIETYVSYVLPSEMPSSFSYEALKAQAVCARTFAYEQITNQTYARYGANLDNTTAFQVYHAIGQVDVCNSAVLDTRGQVLKAGEELITCYYYSTNPGVGTNLVVWGSEEQNYLQENSYLLDEHETFQVSSQDDLISLNLATEEGFGSFIHSSPPSLDRASVFYRWTAELDLSLAQEDELGKVKGIKVQKRSNAGYVTELLVTYEKGTRLLTKESDIRAFLGQCLSTLTLENLQEKSGLVMLPSACFEITSFDGDTCLLTGGGFGHGIGMSQYGANALGNMGYTYEQILLTYYNNTQLTQMK